ncbi:glycosyltransferase involved in cell wall biosynthesis [Salinibacterium amurskyense]|uniref:Glycosyltransferase involved in cell wall biosynthesis n=1 Tax=Salinibacterium amurskyense TaxID=205941 RepID=A0A2M9D7U6_9MICO|nr:glycosyltransferase family 1 protein [Salinibacterium amurskyense]PJJ81785.1 glycosyltransferase involved in cell wall biosynthesis [Salinibacterium amurskyense]RLQ83756.1 glycosyltransferase family 1 protein [Salinibacterium amurskyense]GHD79283.1 glycosyl transferase [Salinibacterium amurskyense]
MTTLRVIIDEMLSPTPGSIARYSEELTRELINAAPTNCYVEAFVSASTEAEYDLIADRLPNLAKLHKSALSRRELRASWQHGFTKVPGQGMLHATSLMAPLRRHDRLNRGEQIAVTVHDVVAWTRPESLGSRQASWARAMLKRAEKYADAIVVPSHTVAQQLEGIANFGDRVRVISGAASASLRIPENIDERANELDLPQRFLLAIGGLDPHRGIDHLIRALRELDDDVVLLLVGPEPGDAAIAEFLDAENISADRVRCMGTITNDDLSVVFDHASAFVYPNLDVGFGMPVLEALSFGIPVVHSDAPALLELAADAGVVVEREPGEGYSEALAEGISRVLNDAPFAERLFYAGQDRARAFSWRMSAEKVWQLHADL